MKNTKRTTAAMLAIALALSMTSAKNHAFARDEPKKELYALSEGLADCSASWLFNSALVEKVLKDKTMSKTLEEQANGAKMAAAWVAFKNNLIPDLAMASQFVEERIAVQMNKKAAYLKALLDEPKAEKEAGYKRIMNESKYCFENYGEKQGEIVTELRREMYKHAAKGGK